MRKQIEAILSVCLLAFLCSLNGSYASYAMAESSTQFLPTWKLLKPEEKQQFIAGYLYGWRDAEKVTEVLADYLKENPKDPVTSINQLKTLYSIPEVDPSVIVSRLDDYFSRPENNSSSLSKAITAVKGSFH